MEGSPTRSAPFDLDRSKQAKRKGRELAGSLEFWFRRKYHLTPNDPRFLELTPEQIETEFWAHHHYENPSKESFENDDFDDDVKEFMKQFDQQPDEWVEEF